VWRFCQQGLYALPGTLGRNDVNHIRGGVLVEHEGEQKPASEWLWPNGRARKLEGARVTPDRTRVGAVVTVRARSMPGSPKEAWCLATNVEKAMAAETVKLYGRRFTTEETFRGQKDLRFGMGLRATHIRSAARRDRWRMLLAIATAFLTLIGAASERAGMDAWSRANTVKRRTHSLFRQGSYGYQCLPTMRDDWFETLMSALAAVLDEHHAMTRMLGQIGGDGSGPEGWVRSRSGRREDHTGCGTSRRVRLEHCS
jgi:hypothetical protein